MNKKKNGELDPVYRADLQSSRKVIDSLFISNEVLRLVIYNDL